ncbi:ABC transporter ATP-binding protein [Bradyrhizobium barranii subsp. apii]|uniref:ABC transporter ATP-binding protein n=1 Tax=Bradyrhizobium barranii subsp. apii TaxID=2819348 RepID=A0A8T5V3A5_9BRAD|nr:ABC transporter ATP-binding protein [Bradyrhizobium barranii]UPT86966.1 ABC transporter ATP-binding protein [Bradyrhizobium barranii subsp. apii]
MLLEISNLSKSYGQLKALSRADLALAEGEFHGLIGPNGSGKSTFLKCIAGVQPPSTGRVLLGGRDITTASPQHRARAGISIKFQLTSIFPELSVYDNMLIASQSRESLVSLVFSRSCRTHRDHIARVLSHFALAERADDLAGVLSNGEQQWLEIAMAMALNPRLLLLDEPTAGLSIEERKLTGEFLRQLHGKCSIIIVEHDLDFIRGLVDHMTVLDQGSVLANGTVAEIQSNTKVQDVYLRRI